MRRALALASLLLVTGCASEPPPESAVELGGVRFRVQIAQSDDQQHTGMAGRAPLVSGTGMFYPFNGLGPQEAWMPGMQESVDLAWIADGQVTGIQTLPPCPTAAAADCPRHPSPGPVDAMLEVPAGELAGIPVGTQVFVTRGEAYDTGS